MIKNALNANREVFENRLSDHAMQFLDELDKKQDVVDKKLRDIEQKKEKIVKKIAENKKNTGNDPKELREYISNSESVLESIEFVYKNINMFKRGGNAFRHETKPGLFCPIFLYRKHRWQTDNGLFLRAKPAVP